MRMCFPTPHNYFYLETSLLFIRFPLNTLTVGVPHDSDTPESCKVLISDAVDYSFGQIIYLPGSFISFSYYLHTIATLSVVVPIKKRKERSDLNVFCV